MASRGASSICTSSTPPKAADVKPKPRVTVTADLEVISAIDNRQLRGATFKDIAPFTTKALVRVADLERWRSKRAALQQNEQREAEGSGT